MSKNIRVLYMYIVCLIAVAMMVTGFITTINAFASYAYPIVYYYDTYSSYDKEKMYDNGESSSDFDVQAYTKSLNEQTNRKKRESLKSGITSIAVVIVGASLYGYHWRKIEADRKHGEV